MTNLHIGMFLELATVTGAIAGALLTTIVAPQLLFVTLGLVLIGSAVLQVVRLADVPVASRRALGERDPAGARRRRTRTGTSGGRSSYSPIRIPLGFALMGFAGLVSGLLGIGSGALKVLAMDGAMGLPDQGQLGDEQLHDRGHRGRLGRAST